VGSAVRVCTLHPPLTKPVAVKLAVKITPEKDDHPHSYHLRRYPICPSERLERATGVEPATSNWEAGVMA
jgi:hypothetical protein